MIHTVIGGSLSGKTTYVRERFVEPYPDRRKDRIGYVPLTICQPKLEPRPIGVIGHYDRAVRTCGVDQMGRLQSVIHDRILTFLGDHAHQFSDIVMEGNAITTRLFMERMKGYPVTLHLIYPNPGEVAERYKKLKINYGKAIIAMSYRRAFTVWNEYKEVWPHVLIER